MEFGKQPFNTRIDKVIDNFIFILLVKYTLQSLKGQKNKKKKEEKEALRKPSFFRLRALGSGPCYGLS